MAKIQINAPFKPRMHECLFLKISFDYPYKYSCMSGIKFITNFWLLSFQSITRTKFLLKFRTFPALYCISIMLLFVYSWLNFSATICFLNSSEYFQCFCNNLKFDFIVDFNGQPISETCPFSLSWFLNPRSGSCFSFSFTIFKPRISFRNSLFL